MGNRVVVRGLSALVVVGALALTSAAPAFAWTTPQDVSNAAGQISRAAFAETANGAAVAVWKLLPPGGDARVLVATRAAGASAFGAAVQLSSDPGPADFADVAIGADGAITAVWISYAGGTQTVQSATRTAGAAAFGAPVTLSSTGASAPRVAIGADGTTAVAWNQAGTPEAIDAVVRAPGASAFGAVQTVVSETDARSAMVAVGPDGTVTVLWKNATHVRAATKAPASAAFAAPQTVSSTGGNKLNPGASIGADGTLVAYWEEEGIDTRKTIQAAVRAPGATRFDAAQDLSSAGDDARAAAGAVAPDGAVAIAWTVFGGANSRVQAATLAAGASVFGAAATIDRGTLDAYGPALGVAPDGAFTAIWGETDSATTITLVSATRPAGAAAFGAVQQLPATGDFLQTGPDEWLLAVAGDGAPTALWANNNGDGTYSIKVSTGSPTLYAVTATRAGTGTGTVTSAPAGIDCGATCSASFALSSSVTLTATATHGARFDGWSGACTGTATTCTVSVLGARTATATFTARVPGPVRRARTGAVGPTSATIRWQQPAVNGGAPIAGYQTRLRTAGGAWSAWRWKAPAAARSTWLARTWTGLRPRTRYEAQVRPVTRAGHGKAVLVAFTTRGRGTGGAVVG